MIFHWFGVPFKRNSGRFPMNFRLMFYRSSFIFLAWCLIYFWVFCCFCFRLGCCCVLLCKIMPFLPFVFLRGRVQHHPSFFKVTLFQSPLWGYPNTLNSCGSVLDVAPHGWRRSTLGIFEGVVVLAECWLLVAGCCLLAAGCWLLVGCRLVGTREANRISIEIWRKVLWRSTKHVLHFLIRFELEVR